MCESDASSTVIFFVFAKPHELVSNDHVHRSRRDAAVTRPWSRKASDWWYREISQPLRQLTSTERAAVICLGVQTGLFPVPGCTMFCLGICMALLALQAKWNPYNGIPKKVLGALSGAINLVLAPVQLVAIPVYVKLAEISGVAAFLDKSMPVVSTGENDYLSVVLQILRSGGAACAVWLLSSFVYVPIGFLLTFVVGSPDPPRGKSEHRCQIARSSFGAVSHSSTRVRGEEIPD